MPPHLVLSRPLVPSNSRIDDRDECDAYWNAMLLDWGVSRPRRGHSSPGCNPCSLTRDTLPQLGHHPYTVAYKSDGVRYALYLTLRRDSTPVRPRPVAIMVDRARTMYEVDVIAPEAYFAQRTLLEGELVWRQPQEKEMLFLVFDCLRSKGVAFHTRPFCERLAEVQRCVVRPEEVSRLEDEDQTYDTADELDGIVLYHFLPRVAMACKTFAKVEDATALWEGRSTAGHRVDGLILQRSDLPYSTGAAKHAGVLKWKQHNTVDLVGLPHALVTSDGERIDALAGAPVTVSPHSRVTATRADDVIEYLLEEAGGAWTLFGLRRRVDKTTANSAYVVRMCLQEIRDGVIAPHELADAARGAVSVPEGAGGRGA